MCLGCPVYSSSPPLLLNRPSREKITDDARSGEEEEEEEEPPSVGRQLADHRDHETRLLLHTRVQRIMRFATYGEAEPGRKRVLPTRIRGFTILRRD